MFDALLEPLQHAFMLRAMLASILVGTVCAVLGAYVVLRGMAFFGDALAHAILPGVAIGYLVEGSAAGSALFWWAMVTAIASALGIGVITRSTRIKEDTAIGIVFAGAFALGVALISTVDEYTQDLTHLLFGNVLAVRSTDLWLIGIFGLLILLIVAAFYKEFLVISFDPILATTLRLPVRLLDFLLLILIAVAIVLSLQIVGLALMVALLVTPAATAYLITRNLPVMMALAAVIAAAAGIVGLYLSLFLNIAAGAAIVLACTAFFLLTWLVQNIRLRMRTS